MYELADKEVEDLANEIIDKFHRHLLKSHITFLFRDRPWKTSESRTILGRASKRNEIDRLLSPKKEDFIILLARPTWDKADLEHKKFLLDHELCHCLISPLNRIFTIDGWKKVKNVEVGDLVLTHTGSFKKVMRTFYTPKEEIEYVNLEVEFPWSESLKRKKTLSLTNEHPVLVNDTWVTAEKLRIGDEINFLGSFCMKCGKIIPYYREFCSQSCQSGYNMKSNWAVEGYKELMSKVVSDSNKKRDNSAWIEAGHKKIKELCDKGLHPFSNGEAIKKSLSISGKRKRSWAERKLEWWMTNNLNEEIVPQLPILKGVMPHNNAKRFYFMDFALPEHKIAIEVNGYFHKGREKEDEIRQKFIESKGWRFIRFSEEQIKGNLQQCGEKIARLVLNDSKRFEFVKAKITNKKIKRGSLPRYNLKVEGDESFVANGFVVHNCGVMVSTDGESKWILRRHVIEDFPENLARFEFRRKELGELIEKPPCAIVSKPDSHRNLTPEE